jgi:hypothetical protein
MPAPKGKIYVVFKLIIWRVDSQMSLFIDICLRHKFRYTKTQPLQHKVVEWRKFIAFWNFNINIHEVKKTVE